MQAFQCDRCKKMFPGYAYHLEGPVAYKLKELSIKRLPDEVILDVCENCLDELKHFWIPEYRARLEPGVSVREEQ